VSVFSYSKKAKELLATYDLVPPPKVVEVDLRGNFSSLPHLFLINQLFLQRMETLSSSYLAV
jgi:hypothetical protein